MFTVHCSMRLVCGAQAQGQVQACEASRSKQQEQHLLRRSILDTQFKSEKDYVDVLEALDQVCPAFCFFLLLSSQFLLLSSTFSPRVRPFTRNPAFRRSNLRFLFRFQFQ